MGSGTTAGWRPRPRMPTESGMPQAMHQDRARIVGAGQLPFAAWYQYSEYNSKTKKAGILKKIAACNSALRVSPLGQV